MSGAFASDNTPTFRAQITARTPEHSGADIGAWATLRAGLGTGQAEESGGCSRPRSNTDAA